MLIDIFIAEKRLLIFRHVTCHHMKRRLQCHHFENAYSADAGKYPCHYRQVRAHAQKQLVSSFTFRPCRRFLDDEAC